MPRRDNHLAARALADWARQRFATSEAAAIAATYGVGIRTVWNWKGALDDDRELAALYRDAVERHVTSSWADELDAALAETIARLRVLIAHSESLAEVTEAFGTLSDVAIAKEMLHGALSSDQAARPAAGDGTNHRNPARLGPN